MKVKNISGATLCINRIDIGVKDLVLRVDEIKEVATCKDIDYALEKDLLREIKSRAPRHKRPKGVQERINTVNDTGKPINLKD